MAKRPWLARTQRHWAPATHPMRRSRSPPDGGHQRLLDVRGELAERGDVIGDVGTTGASDGCHLHFMAFEDGSTVDPIGLTVMHGRE